MIAEATKLLLFASPAYPRSPESASKTRRGRYKKSKNKPTLNITQQSTATLHLALPFPCRRLGGNKFCFQKTRNRTWFFLPAPEAEVLQKQEDGDTTNQMTRRPRLLRNNLP
jgi:hypothetical protein